MKKKSTYIVLLLVVSIVFGVFYAAVQQALRRGANEPQDSMASAVVASLEAGARPQDLVSGQINVATNMAPFVIIYDTSGKVVAGSGYLDGQVPQVPIGVLRAGSRDKPNSITWQPEGNVRLASVSYATRDYYVLGGRSLRVVEKQITDVTLWMLIAWLAVVLLTGGVYTIALRRGKSSTPAAAKSKKRMS
jgi:hypothetical protein